MGGQSRAAKKRAKKKQKKQSSEQGLPQDDASKVEQEQEVSKQAESQNAAEETEEMELEDADQRHGVNDTKKRKAGDTIPGSDDDEPEPSDELSGDGDIDPQKAVSKDEEKEDLKFGSQTPVPRDLASLMTLLSDRDSMDVLPSMTAQQHANCVLNFLLQPSSMTADEFYEKYWEKKALLIQKSSSLHRHRFDGLLSLRDIRTMTKEQSMRYGRDLNVTRYEQDAHGVKRRVTLDLVNPSIAAKQDEDDGINDENDYVEADPEVVWNHYEQGCTVRLLCPHKHANNVQALLSTLELEWGCMVGANAYLTPPSGSQGFAPHYDDIEAFCLQLEGRKRWKVYEPINKGERLPRQSSPDFTEDDLADAKPVLDVVLSPGDILYMPRGWIHHACTLPDSSKNGHSLHLTVSAMQQWAWVDLLEILLPEAIQQAAASETSTALRDGLPIRFLSYMGAIHSNKGAPEILRDKHGTVDEAQKVLEIEQEKFRSEVKSRIMRVAKEAMDLLDASCDQLAKQYLSARQPPNLTQEECKSTSTGQGKAVKIQQDMLVRLVRPGVAHLVLEEGMAIIYHCMDNSRVYHERPLSPMEFEMDDGPALEQLLKTVEPHWLCVEDLMHDTIEDKVGVVQALFDEGLISVRGVN